MNFKNVWSVCVLTAGMAILGTSCTNEKDSANVEALMLTATDETQASSLSDALLSEVDIYVNTLYSLGFSGAMNVKSTEMVVSPVITVDKKDSISFPKIITIDFGTTGIVGFRGKTIKGKIIITITDKIWKAGSTKTLQLIDVFLDDNSIKGVKKITTNALNTNKNPNVTISVSDTITRLDKSVIIRKSIRTRERISDNGTPKIFTDDKFSITGANSGISSTGATYSNTIVKPLIIYNDYPHFVQGSVSLINENGAAVIDYGDSTKDDKATLTSGGKSKDISL